MPPAEWHRVTTHRTAGVSDDEPLAIDEITSVVVAGRAVCLTRTAGGYGALDNRCPHQGGPPIAFVDGPSLVEIPVSARWI